MFRVSPQRLELLDGVVVGLLTERDRFGGQLIVTGLVGRRSALLERVRRVLTSRNGGLCSGRSLNGLLTGREELVDVDALWRAILLLAVALAVAIS